jgi:hypothetical protein
MTISIPLLQLYFVWCTLICNGALTSDNSDPESCVTNPFVKSMGENPSALATSAKFRSLFPFDLSMWYDDGDEGSYLGELRVGIVL